MHDVQAMEPSWQQVQAALTQQQWQVLEGQLEKVEEELRRAQKLVEGYVLRQPMPLQVALRFLTSKLDFDDLSRVSNLTVLQLSVDMQSFTLQCSAAHIGPLGSPVALNLKYLLCSMYTSYAVVTTAGTGRHTLSCPCLAGEPEL